MRRNSRLLREFTETLKLAGSSTLYLDAIYIFFLFMMINKKIY